MAEADRSDAAETVPGPTAATFLFADIAGFTALTEAHGDEQAATLVAEFCDGVTAELPEFGGTHVKSIGDALMLRIPVPSDAVLLGLHIAHELMPRHGAPAVRVGLHHGSYVERDGDCFGATVNLAARVSGQAVGGEVLLTGHTAALAPDIDGVLYEPRGRQQLRNVREPVELFAAVRTGPGRGTHLAVDPVCRMAVDPDHAAGRLMYEGTAYFFCTLELRRRLRPTSRALRRSAEPRRRGAPSGAARHGGVAWSASRGASPPDADDDRRRDGDHPTPAAVEGAQRHGVAPAREPPAMDPEVPADPQPAPVPASERDLAHRPQVAARAAPDQDADGRRRSQRRPDRRGRPAHRHRRGAADDHDARSGSLREERLRVAGAGEDEERRIGRPARALGPSR